MDSSTQRHALKHIYVYAPSGAVRDKAAFRRGVRRLQFLGYTVEIDPDALSSHQRFAGDDAARLAAIHRAAASGADVALIARGGYGLTRILKDIDYHALAQAVARGMQWVGISDFTALQLALLAKTGCISWAGPALCEGFGVGSSPQTDTPPLLPDDIMEDCFGDMLAGRSEGTGWRLPRTVPNGTPPPLHIKDAVLWGGNLTILTTLLATPYFPPITGGILFLEDVGEHPYRIERMLTQLLYAGVLDQQKAILLGQFTEFKLTTHDKGFKLKTVFDWLKHQTQTPILTNLPYGHVATKVLLPVGARTDLVVQGRDALLLWGHLA